MNKELEEKMHSMGYELLMISPKDKKNKEMISLYLNESNNDFKIFFIKEQKNFHKEILEWKVKDAQDLLEKNHPVNQVIEKLEKTKEKNLGLKNIEFKPRKLKLG